MGITDFGLALNVTSCCGCCPCGPTPPACAPVLDDFEAYVVGDPLPSDSMITGGFLDGEFHMLSRPPAWGNYDPLSSIPDVQTIEGSKAGTAHDNAAFSRFAPVCSDSHDLIRFAADLGAGNPGGSQAGVDMVVGLIAGGVHDGPRIMAVSLPFTGTTDIVYSEPDGITTTVAKNIPSTETARAEVVVHRSARTLDLRVDGVTVTSGSWDDWLGVPATAWETYGWALGVDFLMDPGFGDIQWVDNFAITYA